MAKTFVLLPFNLNRLFMIGSEVAMDLASETSKKTQVGVTSRTNIWNRKTATTEQTFCQEKNATKSTCCASGICLTPKMFCAPC